MADTLNDTGTTTGRTGNSPVTPTPATAIPTGTGATASDSTTKKVKETVKANAEKVKAAALKATENVDWKAHGDQLKDQATKTARSAADVAKDKTGSAMQSLSKLISDTASTVDSKLGPQYGDYARYAAEAVSGAAKSLDAKDIDQLIGEARDFVRKSPAVAIGAAAVAGYVLMRLAKGSDSSADS